MSKHYRIRVRRSRGIRVPILLGALALITGVVILFCSAVFEVVSSWH